MTTTVNPPRRDNKPRTPQGKVASWFDDRLRIAGPMRAQLNKVFPDHWSFMMGEIALYSFIILLLTGTYLTFFFDPSMAETTYHGSYVPLRGRHDVAGVRVDARHHLRRPRRPGHPADPPLGGAAVRRGDADPHVPGVLHRRVPQAA